MEVKQSSPVIQEQKSKAMLDTSTVLKMDVLSNPSDRLY